MGHGAHGVRAPARFGGPARGSAVLGGQGTPGRVGRLVAQGRECHEGRRQKDELSHEGPLVEIDVKGLRAPASGAPLQDPVQ